MKSHASSNLLTVAAPGLAANSPQEAHQRHAAIRSETLFGPRRELLIEHAGSIYRLRITQNNKLILTK
jgi:hemin uptake protein HemP